MKSPAELDLPFPDWRPGQRRAIREAQYAKTPHVVINAPTGAGKSLMAAALSKLQPRKRYVTLTATKLLQDQYGGAGFGMADFRGASNYPCRAPKLEKGEGPASLLPILRDWSCDDGQCREGWSCALKDDGCDFFDARREFVVSGNGLTNYAAWLMNRRVGLDLGAVDALVCDEAHALPEQLMAAFGVTVSSYLVDSRKVPRGVKQWKHWAENKLAKLAKTHDDDTRIRRERTERSLRTLATMDQHWAWDRTHDGYRFEPTVPRLLLPLLGTAVIPRIVYLSATMTPATLDLLDIAPDDVTSVTLKSSFPLDTRPIYVLPRARVDFRSMEDPTVVAAWLEAIDDFCCERPDRRGILHAVSFERGRFLYDNLPVETARRLLLHVQGESAAAFAARFRVSPADTIAISPSLTTGVDFAYDAAEFQIVVKLPFPDTRSTIMKARIQHTDRYRDHATMTTLVQTCGRINRAADDSGETAIMDAHFSWWYAANRDLAPDWFDEALVYTRRRVRPLPKLPPRPHVH